MCRVRHLHFDGKYVQVTFYWLTITFTHQFANPSAYAYYPFNTYIHIHTSHMYTHFPITRQACTLYRSAGNPPWTTSLKSLTSETESTVLLDGTLGKSRVVPDIGGGNQIIHSHQYFYYSHLPKKYKCFSFFFFYILRNTRCLSEDCLKICFIFFLMHDF